MKRNPSDVPREQLSAYLDDALGEAKTAQVEGALRRSEALRSQLKTLVQERDRGEHSLGAIWRRNRLSCPTREQLGSYLLGALDRDFRGYIRFHLETIDCSFCQANLADLQSRQKEAPAKTTERRKKFFHSSATLLRPRRKKTK
jgi:hypothetical protein